jgi:hypothetical protein
VTTEVQSQGYSGKGKIHINQRNVTQFASGNNKPSTGSKAKSSSLVYKVAPAGSKDKPVMLRMIENAKLKGYE